LYYGSFFLRGFYLSDGTSFAGDLFYRKVFKERGLAIAQPEVALSRLRGRLAAQVLCGVLAVVLAVGTAWSYLRLRREQGAYSRVLTMGPSLAQEQPGTNLQERLVARRTFLERAMDIKRGRIPEIGTQ